MPSFNHVNESAKGKPVTEQKLLLPIPEIVRQQNPTITQNSGY